MTPFKFLHCSTTPHLASPYCGLHLCNARAFNSSLVLNMCCHMRPFEMGIPFNIKLTFAFPQALIEGQKCFMCTQTHARITTLTPFPFCARFLPHHSNCTAVLPLKVGVGVQTFPAKQNTPETRISHPVRRMDWADCSHTPTGNLL